MRRRCRSGASDDAQRRRPGHLRQRAHDFSGERLIVETPLAGEDEIGLGDARVDHGFIGGATLAEKRVSGCMTP